MSENKKYKIEVSVSLIEVSTVAYSTVGTPVVSEKRIVDLNSTLKESTKRIKREISEVRTNTIDILTEAIEAEAEILLEAEENK